MLGRGSRRHKSPRCLLLAGLVLWPILAGPVFSGEAPSGVAGPPVETFPVVWDLDEHPWHIGYYLKRDNPPINCCGGWNSVSSYYVPTAREATFGFLLPCETYGFGAQARFEDPETGAQFVSVETPKLLAWPRPRIVGVLLDEAGQLEVHGYNFRIGAEVHIDGQFWQLLDLNYCTLIPTGYVPSELEFPTIRVEVTNPSGLRAVWKGIGGVASPPDIENFRPAVRVEER